MPVRLLPRVPLRRRSLRTRWCRKQLVDDARFDVTAMVDLVFMMNIFFLVTWPKCARAEIDLPTARHCTAAQKEQSIVFTVLKGTPAVVYLATAPAPAS